jgi:TRAP-type C4-dicarboxylate transport system substrate-binding protein
MSSRHSLTRRNLLAGMGAGAGGLIAMPTLLRAQTPVVMKIGTSTINDVQHEWMRIFAGVVETKTKNGIKVEIYPASQLGSAPRMIEGTQFGTVQAFVGPPEFLSGVDNRYSVLGAPGLFKDTNHAFEVLQTAEVRDAVLALGSNKGLKGVGLFMYGPASFNFRSKTETLKDIEGKKIRVFASAIQTEPLRKLNATAVPMALSEVLPALQQGTLDGVMSVLPVFTALRFYDAAKHILETDHAAVTVVTVVSKMWYDRLSKEQQAVIDEAGRQADSDVRPWALDALEKSRQTWTANGGTLTRLAAAEQEQLRKMLQPVGAEVTAKNAGEKALYDLLAKAASRST